MLQTPPDALAGQVDREGGRQHARTDFDGAKLDRLPLEENSAVTGPRCRRRQTYSLAQPV